MRKTKSYLVEICIIAVLAALGFVLDRFFSFNTMGTKINLAFIPAAFAAALLGPVAGALVWGLADLTGSLLLPFGPYHPGFTVCAALMGAVFGWLLKREDVTATLLIKTGIAVVINCLVIGLFINTAWVSMLYGSKTYWGWFVYRLPEYAILVPIELIVLPALVKLSGRIKKQFGAVI